MANLNAKISAWGTPGNRGSHNDYLALVAARDVVRQNLFQLGVYAENTTPGDRTSLALIGWSLRAIPRHRVGTLQAVQNLHQQISPGISQAKVKLLWHKPLNAVDVFVNGYKVMRSTTAAFSDAEQIAITTRCSFLDESPEEGANYYWIIPFNASKDGITSDVCVAAPVVLP